jgi:hypothetical protein
MATTKTGCGFYCQEEDFDRKLEELIGEMTPGGILAIPGVYEAVSEALNNDVIDALNREGTDNGYEEDDHDDDG